MTNVCCQSRSQWRGERLKVSDEVGIMGKQGHLEGRGFGIFERTRSRRREIKMVGDVDMDIFLW